HTLTMPGQPLGRAGTGKPGQQPAGGYGRDVWIELTSEPPGGAHHEHLVATRPALPGQLDDISVSISSAGMNAQRGDPPWRRVADRVVLDLTGGALDDEHDPRQQHRESPSVDVGWQVAHRKPVPGQGREVMPPAPVCARTAPP